MGGFVVGVGCVVVGLVGPEPDVLDGVGWLVMHPAKSKKPRMKHAPIRCTTTDPDAK
jgi:hypothetical protein